MNSEEYSLPFPHVHIVEASAGSGKTHILAKRFLKIILSGKFPHNDLSNILAITFTNKAAYQMRQRIFDFLKYISFDQFPSELLKKSILDDLASIKDIRKKAAAKLDYILANFDYFSVQTIDSFIRMLISSCAFYLDLEPDFEIEENPEPYLEEALDILLEAAAQDKNYYRLFKEFLRQYFSLAPNPGWFIKNDILNIVKNIYADFSSYRKDVARETSGTNLYSLQAKIKENLRRIYESLPDKTSKKFLDALRAFLNAKGGSFDSRSSIWNYFLKETLPLNKGGYADKTLADLWSQTKSLLSKYYEFITFARLNIYVELFYELNKQLEELKSRKNAVFLSDLNKKASLLFAEKAIGLPELYLRLALRFYHYLVDEFQDTSGLQWGNLEAMVEEAISEGGSLFYVGDKKQAIFRFRAGQAGLFDALKKKFSYRAEIIEENLTVNYRSCKEIVDFNNRVFSQENLKLFLESLNGEKSLFSLSEADRDNISGIFKGSFQDYLAQNQGGYVRLEKVSASAAAELHLILENRLVELLGSLEKRYPRSAIAVLARKHEQIKQISRWLLKHDIAVESEVTTNIKENFLVKELVSFLRFLSSPIDNLSFAAFIKGEIFRRNSGLGERELNEFIRQNAYADGYLYQAFRDKFPSLWKQHIEKFFKTANFLPLYDFVLGIINHFAILSLFPDYQGFVFKLLELIKQREGEFETSIEDFIDYYGQQESSEDFFLDAASSDAVKVTTIHKAKGLEFEVVIIPFAEANLSIFQRSRSYFVREEADSIKLVYPSKSAAGFSYKAREAFKEEYKKKIADELSTLYVALTRAKRELYIFVPAAGRSRKNHFERLLLQKGDKLEKGELPPSLKKKPLASCKLVFSSPYASWQESVLQEGLYDMQPQNIDLRERGRALHFALSFVKDAAALGENEIVDIAARTSLIFPSFSREEIKVFLNNAVNAGGLKAFFYDFQEVFTEKAVVDKNGRLRIIDRLIIKENEVVIIDYKSSYSQEAFSQLKDYKDIIKEIYPGKKISVFIVFLHNLAVKNIEELTDI